MTIKSKFRHAGCYSLLAFAPIGCSGGSDEESEPDDTSAPGIEIRYTEYGIPHVRASERVPRPRLRPGLRPGA
ncbi:MAG TPA: hypothetical protein VK524_23060 [Polyangiaceae bacterium]|nr:hypothetical protein [Polyangiaceae bacterium]